MNLQPAADAARLRSLCASSVFDTCVEEFVVYSRLEAALFLHPLHDWLESSVLLSSAALRARHLGDPQVDAALARARLQAELTAIFEARRGGQGVPLGVLRRRVARWVEPDSVDRVAAALTAFFRRADIPDAIKHSVLRIAVNAWCTTRRFQAEVAECALGCGLAHADTLEHYIFCPVLHSTAQRHLRLDLTAVQRGGVGTVLELLGSAGDRGMRLAVHIDAVLMAHNRLRHAMGCTGVQSYAARLKEGAKRFEAVARVLTACAVARAAQAAQQDGAGAAGRI